MDVTAGQEARSGVDVRRAHGGAMSRLRGWAVGDPGGGGGRFGGIARAGGHPTDRGRRPTPRRIAGSLPPVLRARPRPDQALAAVATPRRQVSGVHRPGRRPSAHPPDPRRRGGADRDEDRPGREHCGTPLTEAIALAHDCGHGPAGHASEAAFSPYLPETRLRPRRLRSRRHAGAAQPCVSPRWMASATTPGADRHRRLRRARWWRGPDRIAYVCPRLRRRSCGPGSWSRRICRPRSAR